MLAALGYWGFETGDSTATQWLLGIGAPVLAAAVWGAFIAPKATVRVPSAVWIGLQVIVFGAATLALAAAAPSLALPFAVAVILDGAALAVVGV
jgi:hypothetical protein